MCTLGKVIVVCVWSSAKITTILSVYNCHGYVDIVGRLAEQSMQGAVEEVQTLPDYPTSGEVNRTFAEYNNLSMSKHFLTVGHTDARHDSTANAYHTTVPCLSGR